MTQISLDLSPMTLSEPPTSLFSAETATDSNGSFTQHLARAQSDNGAPEDSAPPVNDTPSDRTSPPAKPAAQRAKVEASSNDPPPADAERQPASNAEPAEATPPEENLSAAESAEMTSTAPAESTPSDADGDEPLDADTDGSDLAMLDMVASLLAPPIILTLPTEQPVTTMAVEPALISPVEASGQVQGVAYASSLTTGVPAQATTPVTPSAAPEVRQPTASAVSPQTATSQAETVAMTPPPTAETTPAVQPNMPVETPQPVEPAATAEQPTATDSGAVQSPEVPAPPLADPPEGQDKTPTAADAALPPADDATSDVPPEPAAETAETPTATRPQADMTAADTATADAAADDFAAADAAAPPANGQPKETKKASATESAGHKPMAPAEKTEQSTAAEPAQAVSPATVAAGVVAKTRTAIPGDENQTDDAAAPTTIDATSTASATADSNPQQADAAARANQAGNSTNAPVASHTTTAASATDAGAADQGQQVDRVRFAQRVSRAFEALGDRGGSLRLKLSPPELGNLNLEVTVQQGVLTARLETETPAARNLLLESLPGLRDRLAQQDIRVERFDVELMDRRSGGGAEQFTGQSDSGRQSPERSPTRRVSADTSTATATNRASSVGSDNNHLNIVI